MPNEKCRHMAFVGATITVLMLLFDPFLQQVVVYPDRLVASDKTATIVRAQNYVARSEEGLPLPSIVDMSMKVCTENAAQMALIPIKFTIRLLYTRVSSMSAIKQTSIRSTIAQPASKLKTSFQNQPNIVKLYLA